MKKSFTLVIVLSLSIQAANAGGIIPFLFMPLPATATPTGFDFADVSSVAPSSPISSQILQMNNLSSAASVSISGTGSPLFRVCNDSTCSTNPSFGSSGSVSSGQYLQLQVTSSATALASVTATVTIGEFSDNWSAQTADLKSYFVLTQRTFLGNLGGLAGANSKCVEDLTNYDWKGKSTAGPISPARVKAWLCDGSSCQNLTASTAYYFATAGNTSNGGGSFTTDGSGVGPNDSTAWNLSTTFGTPATAYLLTGRATGTATAWANTSAADHCSGWTTSSGGANRGENGNFANTNALRWAAAAGVCNNAYPIVCAVEPASSAAPAFSFTDVTGAASSTFISSNIIQITGLSGALPVGVSGSYSPQFRVCSDATCTAGSPPWLPASNTTTTISNNQYLQIGLTTLAQAGVFYSANAFVGSTSSTWQVIGAGAPLGYFVVSGNASALGSGGVVAKDTFCYSELNGAGALNWINKSTAAAYMSPGTVKAFLCDDSSCPALVPNIVYYFSNSGSTSLGGATFTSDANGAGPGDNANWSGSTYFGSNYALPTGRLQGGSSTTWPSTPDVGSTCSGWTTTSGNGAKGDAGNTTAARWGGVATPCSGSNRIVCMVNPTVRPLAMNFQNVTNAAKSQVITSNIVALNGITASSTVSISGGSSPEFQICNDSTCSSVATSWTSTTTTNVAGTKYLQLRQTSSASGNTTSTTTVTVGALSSTWSLKTGP